MTLSRGSHAFDLFLQLTQVCQVYLYSVFCMLNTCHPCTYDEESINFTKRLQNQFEALYCDFDFKQTILDPTSNKLGEDLTTQQIVLFQEVADFRLNTISLKESVTVISNYIDIHLAEEVREYDYGHERYINQEQKRAIDAERKLKDLLPHEKLRKYLTGHIASVDTLKASQLRKLTLVSLE